MATAQAQETLLSDAKLHDELNFIKRHTELLASNQIQHESAYVPPLEHRHKKATLVNVSQTRRLCSCYIPLTRP